MVALMDGLFTIDREAREQNLSLEDRHALRQERAPALLDELKPLLLEMLASGYLKKSVAGQAIAYTLKRWQKLTHFLEHPVIELSTNWAENSMRPIAIGRRNWLQIGSKEAGPKIAAIFSSWRAAANWVCPFANIWPTCCLAWPTAPSNHWLNSLLWPTPQK